VKVFINGLYYVSAVISPNPSPLLVLSLFSSQCEPCCSTCSERRRRLFVQDPETCQCSCKHSEADCRSRQLELNERTCRCVCKSTFFLFIYTC